MAENELLRELTSPIGAYLRESLESYPMIVGYLAEHIKRTGSIPQRSLDAACTILRSEIMTGKYNFLDHVGAIATLVDPDVEFST